MVAACSSVLGLLLAGQPAMAQTLKPGLWKTINKMQSDSGKWLTSNCGAVKPISAHRK